ncbi:MAG: sporulation protein [Eubacterium sp.]|jgi:sporulation protein YqfC|nr:sporulation protein [Eubacterium sp.]
MFGKRRNILSSEIKQSVVRAFDLPADLAYGSVLVSVTGQNELLIENYRGILEYKDEHIRIQAKDCRILIVGKQLKIEYYTNEEMKIKGFIEQILYEN